ncbi:MAG: hypothetical protein U0470_11500 [Anaerolineae bacterium]
MNFLDFEHRSEALASTDVFVRRLARHGGATLLMAAGSLGVGMAGYHFTERMSWLDAYVNAAMILSGMGPAGTVKTAAGKLFAGSYALFSGVVFLLMAAVIIAPLAHRLLHRLHLEETGIS